MIQLHQSCLFSEPKLGTTELHFITKDSGIILDGVQCNLIGLHYLWGVEHEKEFIS